jgi:hypothetical protein
LFTFWSVFELASVDMAGLASEALEPSGRLEGERRLVARQVVDLVTEVAVDITSNLRLKKINIYFICVY